MIKTIRNFASRLALLSAAFSGLLFLKNRAPRGMILLLPKLYAGALAPFSLLAGAAGTVLGLLFGAPLATVAGIFGAVASGRYLRNVTAGHDGFEKAFGPDWESHIPLERRLHLLPQHWSWKLAPSPEPVLIKDIAFWTLPDTGRELKCDLWTPAESVAPSGLALIFIHGGGWVFLDKDTGTRTFFRHLCGQGHVVMDVAYRLSPETGMDGMVGDIKRAIAWMKAHAGDFDVNPDRIVLCGGSSGGHLVLLAAYAPTKPELTPEDVRQANLSVRGVISEYGPTDLVACYFHTNQDKIEAGSQPQPVASPAFTSRLMGKNYHRLGFDKGMKSGLLNLLLGGRPDEVPERYALYSPVNYAHPGCPPTLLIQGEDDLITSVEATRQLYQKLVEAGVPAVNVVFPQTDHGFDLVLPKVSPVAQSAFYEIDRFLALMD